MKTWSRLVWKVALVCASGFPVLTSSHGQAASIVVTSLGDSGAGSLRAAISNANDGDVISFAVSGTITNLTGELVIGKNLAIQGPGPGALAVSGNNSNRVFNVGGGATVSLSDLTISDGHARDGAKGTNSATPGWPGENGGGIYSSGTLVLSNCLITRCRSGGGGAGHSDPLFPSLPGSSDGGPGGNGGGIYNAGSLTLVNCRLTTNTSASGGSGGRPLSDLPGSAGGAGGNGGGIYDVGTLTVMAVRLASTTLALAALAVAAATATATLTVAVAGVAVMEVRVGRSSASAIRFSSPAHFPGTLRAQAAPAAPAAQDGAVFSCPPRAPVAPVAMAGSVGPAAL